VPQTCGVCKSPSRLNIEEALLSNIPLRTISKRFLFSTAALHRHRRNHLSSKLVKAVQAAEVLEATTLLGRVEALILRCEDIAKLAEQEKHWVGASAALREVGRSLELLGKITGQLRSGVNVGVAIGMERPEEIAAGVNAKVQALLEL